MGMHLNPRMEPQSLPLALHSEDLSPLVQIQEKKNEQRMPRGGFPGLILLDGSKPKPTSTELLSHFINLRH